MSRGLYGRPQAVRVEKIVRLQAFGQIARVKFNALKTEFGDTAATNTNRLLISQYNVTRVLRNGTGDFTIYFTEPFATMNFNIFVFAKTDAGGTKRPVPFIYSADLDLTTQKRIRMVDLADASWDPPEVHVLCMGD